MLANIQTVSYDFSGRQSEIIAAISAFEEEILSNFKDLVTLGKELEANTSKNVIQLITKVKLVYFITQIQAKKSDI